MGNNSSSAGQDSEATAGPGAAVVDTQQVGYRILGVQPNSPTSYCSLVAHFDFIVAANSVPLKTLDTTFIELIRASEDKPMTLTIYNTKNHTLREVAVVPSRKWPGEGMLGATIRFDSYEDCDDQLVHVLEVEANSPAEIAGLQAGSDYLLGTLEKTFKDTECLFNELQQNIDHPLEIIVYNSERDEVRNVVIMPTRQWNGEGLLGASVASGILHRLPASATESIGRASDSVSVQKVNSAFGQNSEVLPTPDSSSVVEP